MRRKYICGKQFQGRSLKLQSGEIPHVTDSLEILPDPQTVASEMIHFPMPVPNPAAQKGIKHSGRMLWARRGASAGQDEEGVEFLGQKQGREEGIG